MSKQMWKSGTFLYPIPAVMVSCGTMEKSNIITVAWTGILNTDPAMVYISVRPSRYSYNLIKEQGEFVINLTTKDLVKATDWCGVRSGAQYDNFKEMNLHKEKANFVTLGADQQIDFGGIAKGYTSSRIMDIYKDNGITSGLVNLGGNVQALGTKTDGTKWKIAVQSPDDTEDYLGILSVQDKAVITSGGYERYFEQDGVTYHHIIDPKTGYPAESGLVSVTIVSEDGTLADGLSTSLFIMGKEKAADFWREHKDDFDAILMSDDGTLYVTEGLENDFSTERTVEIIR